MEDNNLIVPLSGISGWSFLAMGILVWLHVVVKQGVAWPNSPEMYQMEGTKWRVPNGATE